LFPSEFGISNGVEVNIVPDFVEECAIPLCTKFAEVKLEFAVVFIIKYSN